MKTTLQICQTSNDLENSLKNKISKENAYFILHHLDFHQIQGKNQPLGHCEQTPTFTTKIERLAYFYFFFPHESNLQTIPIQLGNLHDQNKKMLFESLPLEIFSQDQIGSQIKTNKQIKSQIPWLLPNMLLILYKEEKF